MDDDVDVFLCVDHVELMEQNGELVNLMRMEKSSDPVSSLLKDRHRYIVVCVTREDLHTNIWNHFNTDIQL